MKQLLRQIDAMLFGHLHDQHVKLLQAELVGSESVLDVGCGATSPLGRVTPRPRRSCGVDGFRPALDRSRAAGIHDEYRQMNILEIGSHFPAQSFDTVLASDVIEHLEKADGLRFVQTLEKLAKRKVILFTPNGFQPQGQAEGNIYQIHRSGWEVDEMRALGYNVMGVNGWKPLRGEFAAIRFRPHWLWARLSLVSQLFVTGHPRAAYQIFCVKDVAQTPASK